MSKELTAEQLKAAIARCWTNIQVYRNGYWGWGVELGSCTIQVVNPVVFDIGEG
mgnify:CR=1 FL=1